VNDCPFNAVALQPRTDDSGFSAEAVVSSSLCTGCGICAGACPTSTPFRRTPQLVPGIDVPDMPIHTLREQSVAAAAGLSGNARIVVYGCAHGPGLEGLRGMDTAVLTLPCIAMLPPSFLDFLISRRHAEGVFLTGCAAGDCHYRLGQQWMEQRLAGTRDPYLRARVPRERIAICWAGLLHGERLRRELAAFRERLGGLPAPARRRSRTAAATVHEAQGDG
jgi:coenzyme F420-reducing hydrogenase delta subunit